MEYINNNRKLGLTGLLRVRNDELTLAQSIDSCIDALDELVITYNDCTDRSVKIIENAHLKYPDKIIVVPYPHHVIVKVTEETKSLPIGSPQLVATYYNNALQYVNYKYVMKIDADQVYFTDDLKKLRDCIVKGVKQSRLSRFCGKVVNVFCQKRANKRIWSKYHLLHWMQFVVVPLFRKQYMDYAVSELLKGNGYLSLSGVNVLRYDNQWCSPCGSWPYNAGGDHLVWPYNGFGDHLVFEADENTEYLPSVVGYSTIFPDKQFLIERFDHPKEKTIFLFGFYWFHLKPMKDSSFDKYISYLREHDNIVISVCRLGKVKFSLLLKHLDNGRNDYHSVRAYYNFVHNLDKKSIIVNEKVLDCFKGLIA